VPHCSQATFSGGGLHTSDLADTGKVVRLQSAGKITVVGRTGTNTATYDFALARVKVASSLEERTYVETDVNHNVTSVSDTFGAVKERFVYDPYGAATVLTAAFGATSDSLSWVYRDQGLRYDSVSNSNDNRERVYLIGLGRSAQADQAGYIDGANRYQREGDAPTRSNDPTGLYDEDFHYYAVYFVLRAKGFSAKEAHAIAGYSQYNDDNDWTEPLFCGIEKRHRFHFASKDVTVPTQRDEPGARNNLKEQWKNYINSSISGATELLGAALHTYADTWSHEGFSAQYDPKVNKGDFPQIGHAGMDHIPDEPAQDPKKALDALKHIYDLTPDKEGEVYFTWEQIKDDVYDTFEQFCDSDLSHEEQVAQRVYEWKTLIRKYFGKDEISYNKDDFEPFKNKFEKALGKSPGPAPSTSILAAPFAAPSSPYQH